MIMIHITGTKQGELLEVQTEKTATQEDLAAFKEAVENKLLQEEPLSILFIFKNIEGITSKAVIEDRKSCPYITKSYKGANVAYDTFTKKEIIEDMKTITNIKKIYKGAIVADDTFTKKDEAISKFIPGVQVEHFDLEEIEEAKKWLTRD